MTGTIQEGVFDISLLVFSPDSSLDLAVDEIKAEIMPI